jgi:predicted dehydrogenase
MTKRWRTGILGCGDIAPRYIRSLLCAENIELVAAAARTPGAAGRCAELFGGLAVAPDDLLDAALIEAVVILTPPQDHETAITRAIEQGIHVYCEKPFALSVPKAQKLTAMAEQAKVMLACAPATHLGPSLTRARRLIEEGSLGQIIGGAATMVYPGPDLWHHNPDHLFASGGGPLWDMGVYHLAALVFLLGPIQSVQAAGSAARPERIIRQGPRAGTAVPVEVPTHIAALVRFASGATVTVTFSFDGFGSRAPGIEIYGTAGAIALGQPNDFAAPLHMSQKVGDWGLVEDESGWSDVMWAIGVVEALDAREHGRAPRTAPDFATHVIDAMAAIEGLCHDGIESVASIGTRCLQPEPVSGYERFAWCEGSGQKAGTRP